MEGRRMANMSESVTPVKYFPGSRGDSSGGDELLKRNATQRQHIQRAIVRADREVEYSDLATRVALLCVTRRRPDFELFPLMPSLTVERSVRQLQVLAILQHSHLS